MYDLETMGTVKNQVKVIDAYVEDFDDIDEENQNIFQKDRKLNPNLKISAF